MATTYAIELVDGPFEFKWPEGENITAATQPALWAKLRQEFRFDHLFVRTPPHGHFLFVDLDDSYYGQPYFKMTSK
jgi:hypothetical protein